MKLKEITRWYTPRSGAVVGLVACIMTAVDFAVHSDYPLEETTYTIAALTPITVALTAVGGYFNKKYTNRLNQSSS